MITTISPQIVCLWIVSTGTTYWVCKVLNVHFFPPLSCNFYVEILSKTLAIVMTTSFYTAISIFPLGGLCRNFFGIAEHLCSSVFTFQISGSVGILRKNPSEVGDGGDCHGHHPLDEHKGFLLGFQLVQE